MPNNNRGGPMGYTAADKKNVQLPDKFVCDYCKKMKSPPQFSEKEKNKYRHAKLTGQKVNHITIKLRCMECTGTPVTELQCNGPCGLWRGLDEFSKAARTRGDATWCIKCTNWKEAHEPGVTMMPAPNNDIAPDEERMTMSASYDPEGEADSDDDDYYVSGEMSNLNISQSTYGNVETSSAVAPTSNNENTAPHLRAMQKSETTASNPYASRSNTTNTSASETATEDGGGVWVTEDRRRKKQTYAAYDPSGNLHDRTLTESSNTGYASSSRAESTTSSKPPKVVTGKSGWAKVPNNKTRGFAPQPTSGGPLVANASSGVQYRDDDDSQDEM